jgi:hypothetical protein
MSTSGSGGRGGNANGSGSGGRGGRDVKGKGRAGGGHGSSRGGRGGVRRAADYTPAQEPRVAQEAIAEASRIAIEKAEREEEAAAEARLAADGEEEEVDTCYICAEPVKYYALGTCSHRTCHVCSLRLRALYKKRECTFCKVCVIPSICKEHLCEFGQYADTRFLPKSLHRPIYHL